ncbi:MAG: histidine kinase [Pseudomonadota bacterium]
MQLATHLMLRLLISGLAILVLAISWLMYSNNQQWSREIVAASDAMLRILAIQNTGIRQGIGLEPRFPDWYPVTQVNLPKGACVRLLDESNRPLNTTCRGLGSTPQTSPDWFQRIYLRAFSNKQTYRREFSARKKQFVLEIVTDPDIEVVTVWKRTELAIILTISVLLFLGLITAWSIRSALKPVKAIVNYLGDLGSGSAKAELSSLRFRELKQIAEACEDLSNNLETERKRRNALVEELNSAQEEERRAIALELHDEFGQHLSGIAANALALNQAAALDVAREDAARISESVQQLKDLLEKLLQRLRPFPEESNSLEKGALSLLRDLERNSQEHVTTTFNTEGDIEQLPVSIRAVAFRIIQESLTNVYKHAGATHVEVQLAIQGSYLDITVRDDGKITDANSINLGFGMSGMRERVAALDGAVDFLPADDHGLIVHARLPIERHNPAT